VIERQADFTVPANVALTAPSNCQPGEISTGGGYRFGVNVDEPAIVYHSMATAGNTGWVVTVFNPSNGFIGLSVFAECASLLP
jgi:hypothetical protein